MSDKRKCVTCEYEDASNRLSSNDPAYPGPRGETGMAIWCNYYNRYIADDDRQAVRKKPDGSYEDHEWCTAWKPFS